MVLKVQRGSRRVRKGPGRSRGSGGLQEGLEVGKGPEGSRRVQEGLEVWEGLGGWGGAQKRPGGS